MVVIIYAIVKFMDLGTVRGSTISYYTREDSSMTSTASVRSVNLQARNFRVAFAFDGVTDGKFKSDPRFVRYIAEFMTKKDHQWTRRILPHHVCTEEDYAQFYPVQASLKATLDRIRSRTDLDFLCIDWPEEDPFVIFGNDIEMSKM